MNDAPLETLVSAIARNCGAVLTLPFSQALRHSKTRFLTEDSEGFWIQSDPAHAALIDDLIVKGISVGIAFKHGPAKTIFTTPVLRREPGFRVNQEMTVEALLLRFPSCVKTVQRRSNYRVAIPASWDISIRTWQIPEHWILRDKPPSTMEVTARLRDLSVSGAGLLVPPTDGQPVRIVAGVRLRVQVKYASTEAILEARVAHIQSTPDQSLRVGIQFKKLEDDMEGRQILSRLTAIVGELHRCEVRRLRLGVCEAPE